MKKVAVVTGASSGIGYYIASYYKTLGYRVIAVQRTTVNEFENISCDFGNFQSTDKALETLKEEDVLVDTLVNNAGVMYLDDFAEGAGDTVSVDLLSPILFTRRLINYDLIPTGGHIINIASVSGVVGDVDAPVYSACKAGIINLTRSLAKAYAPNIRVNCISPGFFKTNLVGGDTPQELIDRVPLKREAEAHEIVDVIAFLHRAKYVTGANIVIDGGLSL